MVKEGADAERSAGVNISFAVAEPVAFLATFLAAIRAERRKAGSQGLRALGGIAELDMDGSKSVYCRIRGQLSLSPIYRVNFFWISCGFEKPT